MEKRGPKIKERKGDLILAPQILDSTDTERGNMRGCTSSDIIKAKCKPSGSKSTK